MKKMLTISIAVLLIAGAVTIGFAYYADWSGSGDGSCINMTITPMQPWEGLLVHDHSGADDEFEGFWGNTPGNEMIADDEDNNINSSTTGGKTFIHVGEGTWNYRGDIPTGTWTMTFNITDDTCSGSWEDDSTLCTDGDCWGTEDE